MRFLYSGYDYFLADELSSQIQNNLINKLKQKLIKQITNEKLCRYLFQGLRPFIHESHVWKIDRFEDVAIYGIVNPWE